MAALAPEMFMHTAPAVLQSCHWSAYPVGAFVHVPFVAVRVSPRTVAPATVGRTLIAGDAPPEPVTSALTSA